MSKKNKAVDPIYREKFIEDLNRFIQKVQSSEINNPTTCATVFDNSDQYADEKSYLEEIATENFATTKDRGDALEKLILKIFNRIELLDSDLLVIYLVLQKCDRDFLVEYALDSVLLVLILDNTICPIPSPS